MFTLCPETLSACQVLTHLILSAPSEEDTIVIYLQRSREKTEAQRAHIASWEAVQLTLDPESRAETNNRPLPVWTR